MNDEPMHDDPTAIEEMEQRLLAYADARLSPSPEAVDRMRAAIVARAAGAAAMRDVQRPSAALNGRGWWPFRSRRAAGVLLAASLTVGSAAAVFAATPGSPLYATRLWLQSLTLPSSGDARIAAQVDQLEQRDAEVAQASLAQDPAAITSALAAFDQEIADAVRDAGNDPARLARLEIVLQKHITVLQGVEASAPAAAVPAIEAAIEASSKAIAQIEANLRQLPGLTPGHTPPPRPTPDARQTPAPNATSSATKPTNTQPPRPSPSHK